MSLLHPLNPHSLIDKLALEADKAYDEHMEETKMTDKLERDKLEAPNEVVQPNAFPTDTGSEPTPQTSDEDDSEDGDSDPTDDELTLAPEFADVPVIGPEDAGEYPDHDDLQDDLEGLGAPGDSPRSPAEAIQYARHLANSNYDDGYGYCLQNVRTYYGVGAMYGYAKLAWDQAETKHHVEPHKVPRGVPVFWGGGSQGYGHIALAIGDGLCLSTDWASDGSIGVARISDLSNAWNLEFLGYTREVNEVVVWRPGKSHDKPEPKPVPVRFPHIKKAIVELKKARDIAKREHNMRRYHILVEHIADLRKMISG